MVPLLLVSWGYPPSPLHPMTTRPLSQCRAAHAFAHKFVHCWRSAVSELRKAHPRKPAGKRVAAVSFWQAALETRLSVSSCKVRRCIRLHPLLVRWPRSCPRALLFAGKNIPRFAGVESASCTGESGKALEARTTLPRSLRCEAEESVSFPSGAALRRAAAGGATPSERGGGIFEELRAAYAQIDPYGTTPSERGGRIFGCGGSWCRSRTRRLGHRWPRRSAG